MRCFATTLLAGLALLIGNLVKPEKVKKEVLKKASIPTTLLLKLELLIVLLLHPK